MGRVAIFVDGGYLEHVQHALGDPKIAFDKMAASIAQPDELLRTYYYHCLPYQSPTPTAEEAGRFARKQRFFHALHRLGRFEVREGCGMPWILGPRSPESYSQRSFDRAVVV